MKSSIKALLLLLAAGVLLAVGFMLPIGENFSAGADWIDRQGPLAWGLYVLGYIVAAVLLIPGSLLTLAAGFLFGLPLGIALVSLGSVLGASSAFLVGRFFARDWVAAKLRTVPRFHALDGAIASEGFSVVLLTRLSPLFPFNLTNYGLGLSAVRFRDYVLASWIGMLPGTCLYVYLGTLAGSLAELIDGPSGNGWLSRGLLIAGFIATAALAALIAKKANRMLERQLDANTAGPD